jgi:hypothetical protein
MLYMQELAVTEGIAGREGKDNGGYGNYQKGFF